MRFRSGVFISFILLLTVMTVPVNAQLSNISVAVNGGKAYLRLNEIENWYNHPLLRGDFSMRDIVGNFDAQVRYRISGKSAIVLDGGYMTNHAFHRQYYSKGIDYSETDMDISTVPVNLSYERRLKQVFGIDLYAGAGGGLYFSKLHGDVKTSDDAYEQQRRGTGYGLHTYAVSRYVIYNKLFLQTRFRARYADGMFFTGDSRDVKIDFTGVDLTFGIGYNFGR